ncbi:MAG: iron-sulfur cluster insertion protein ErpA [Planctomycetota bacterium]
MPLAAGPRQTTIFGGTDMTTVTTSEPQTDAPVLLSESAAREIKTIIEQQELDADKIRLRVGVKGGGCSGFSYILDLTESFKETDEEFEQHGVKMVCDPKSLLYLGGVTIDFKDEIMGRGFVFNNPNASSTCGCGSSFSA